MIALLVIVSAVPLLVMAWRERDVTMAGVAFVSSVMLVAIGTDSPLRIIGLGLFWFLLVPLAVAILLGSMFGRRR